MQFDGNDTSEVELDGSLCVTTDSKELGAAVAGWSGAVATGCFLGRPTEHSSAGFLNLLRNFVG